jgi:hypothetical protein
MKPELFILPVAAAALVLTSGCQSGSPDINNDSSAPAEKVTAAPITNAPAAPPAPAKVALPTVRINAGAGAIKDGSGMEWLAEAGFDGGDVIERPDVPIANTTQPEIYRSEHYSMDAFKYTLPNGKYHVKLHFCETYEGIMGPGERVFSFDVEGKPFKDFDVWVKSGGGARAYVETIPVDITDGQLDIKFTPQVENPQINAIEISPAL